MGYAILGVLVAFAGSNEKEMFENGVSPLWLGVDWLFTFDIPEISMEWYGGIFCTVLGVFLMLKKRKLRIENSVFDN